MGDEDRLLTAFTTEHFTLATARATAVAESNARTSHHLLAVSSALIAIGFVSQISRDELFDVFVLTVLPSLFVLGLFTFMRLTESSIEDFRYAQAINRIRHYYAEIAGEHANYLLMPTSDDRAGVWASMSLAPSRWHSYMTMPMAMAFVNSVIGGSAVALALGIAIDASLGASVAGGAVFAVVSLVLHYRHNEHSFQIATSGSALFPSPASSATRGDRARL